MKKTILSALVAVFGFATQATAQSSMLATLNHEGTVSTFYGATALREAHAAAAHGDIITLSSGTFVSVNITKAVTLRGAGMEVDTLSGTEPTVISGNFNIQIADSVSQRLVIEGVYNNHKITCSGTINNAMFLKNRFYQFSYLDQGILKNASFIHSRITDFIALNTGASASFINCVIEDPESKSESNSNFEFMNCVIKFNNMDSYKVMSSSYKNCLISGSNSSATTDYIHSSCNVYNCIGFNHSEIFKNMPNSTNAFITDIKTIFKTYAGQSLQKLDSENFELTDAAKTKYLGTDGTQVGIHGGMLPFDSTPSNPQITKCNVASKSTADGKLSVDIEVKAAE